MTIATNDDQNVNNNRSYMHLAQNLLYGYATRVVMRNAGTMIPIYVYIQILQQPSRHV